MAMSLEEQQKRQFAAGLAVDLIKPMADRQAFPEHVTKYFDKIFDAIYEKLSEKA